MLKKLAKVIIALIILFGFAYVGILTVEWQNLRQTQLYVHGFTPLADLNTYAETLPKIYLAEPKIPHAVLLLHGWSASPQEFQTLVKKLRAANIPYYAPQLTGFGLGDMHLLRNIEISDWLRDAIYGYDVLAARAKEISIIGHSNGGVLAVYVAQQRPVKHLILAAPNLAVSKADKIYKTVLNMPVLSQILQYSLPVFSKPVRPSAEQQKLSFRYPTLPIKSLIALWQLQDKVNITKANFQDLTLVYGKQDQDVDIPAVMANFNNAQLIYKSIEYPQSAHNLLEGKEQAQVMQDIVAILKK